MKQTLIILGFLFATMLHGQVDSIPDNIEYNVKKSKGKYIISQIVKGPESTSTTEFSPMDSTTAKAFLDNALINNDSIAVRIEAELKEIQLNIDWHKKQLEAFQAKKKQLQMEGQIAVRQRPKLIKLREKIN